MTILLLLLFTLTPFFAFHLGVEVGKAETETPAPQPLKESPRG